MSLYMVSSPQTSSFACPGIDVHCLWVFQTISLQKFSSHIQNDSHRQVTNQGDQCSKHILQLRFIIAAPMAFCVSLWPSQNSSHTTRRMKHRCEQMHTVAKSLGYSLRHVMNTQLPRVGNLEAGLLYQEAFCTDCNSTISATQMQR